MPVEVPHCPEGECIDCDTARVRIDLENRIYALLASRQRVPFDLGLQQIVDVVSRTLAQAGIDGLL